MSVQYARPAPGRTRARPTPRWCTKGAARRPTPARGLRPGTRTRKSARRDTQPLLHDRRRLDEMPMRIAAGASGRSQHSVPRSGRHRTDDARRADRKATRIPALHRATADRWASATPRDPRRRRAPNDRTRRRARYSKRELGTRTGDRSSRFWTRHRHQTEHRLDGRGYREGRTAAPWHASPEATAHPNARRPPPRSPRSDGTHCTSERLPQGSSRRVPRTRRPRAAIFRPAGQAADGDLAHRGEDGGALRAERRPRRPHRMG